jgi:hypothetical protein
MATYHCSIKVGGKGRGAAHAAYISREVPYARREGLEHCEHGNLPAWAQADPLEFWRAADTHERANGAVYREIEVALPRELTPVQRRELMHDFIQVHLGPQHAYTLAIHNPTAALDGGEQPHAHLMFSERIQDSTPRDPAPYFKRYNAKAPERGGCRKDSMGTLERLQTFRASWTDLANQALERYGHEARIDHRSYRDRGIERKPEKHLGPVDARRLSREDWETLQAHRQAQQDVSHEQQRVSRLDIAASLQAAIQERDTRIELAEMIQTGRAEARQEYATWKADQERLALERERAQARREFKDWQHEHVREHALPDHKRQRELDKTRDLERDNDLGLSL